MKPISVLICILTPSKVLVILKSLSKTLDNFSGFSYSSRLRLERNAKLWKALRPFEHLEAIGGIPSEKGFDSVWIATFEILDTLDSCVDEPSDRDYT